MSENEVLMKAHGSKLDEVENRGYYSNT